MLGQQYCSIDFYWSGVRVYAIVSVDILARASQWVFILIVSGNVCLLPYMGSNQHSIGPVNAERPPVIPGAGPELPCWDIGNQGM